MKPSENLGMPTSHAIIHGPWYPMVSHDIPWYPMDSYGIPWYPIYSSVSKCSCQMTDSYHGKLSISAFAGHGAGFLRYSQSMSWWACRWKAGPHQENHQTKLALLEPLDGRINFNSEHFQLIRFLEQRVCRTSQCPLTPICKRIAVGTLGTSPT